MAAAADKKALIEKVVKAHGQFTGSFTRALGYARIAGDCLHRLQADTGLKGEKLFALVWGAGCQAKRGTLYSYMLVSERWGKLEAIVGEEAIKTLNLTRALALMRNKNGDQEEAEGEKPVSFTARTSTPKRIASGVVKQLTKIAAQHSWAAEALRIVSTALKAMDVADQKKAA